MDDWKQLAAWLERADEDAFAALVNRHIGLVYSAALRQTGDRSTAEEIVQGTFVLLVEKAPTLRPTGSLGSWLYNAACLKGKESLRRDTARRIREQKANEMNTPTEDEPPLDWAKVAPLLEEAMQSLSEADRDAVLMRYFQKRPLREVGEALGLSEDAARKRVARALDRLNSWLTSRGIACSVVALAAALPREALAEVPAHLAQATIEAVALAGASTAAAGAGGSMLTILGSTKVAIAAALVIGLAIPVTIEAVRSKGRLAPTADLPVAAPPPTSLELPVAEASGLIAEWEKLRAEHGPDAGSMPALYAAIKEIKDSFRRRVFRNALVAEWSIVDPEGGLAFLREKEGWLVKQFLLDWIPRDPAAAAAALLANPKGIEDALSEVLVEFARRGPEHLEKLVEYDREKNLWRSETQAAFAVYAERDFSAARTMAESLKGSRRGEALAGVAKVWAERDGAAALEWAQAIEDKVERSSALGALLEGWAKSDPVAALDHLHLGPPGGRVNYGGTSTASRVLSAAAGRDFDATMEWIGENRDNLPADLGGLHSAIARRLDGDVAGTLEMLADHSASSKLRGVLGNILMNQGYDQRDAVWDWIVARPEGDAMAGDLMRSLMGSAAWKDPDVALTWLDDAVAVSGNRAEVIGNLAQRAPNGGHDISRIDYLLEVAPDDMRATLLELGFKYMGQNDKGPIDPWLERLEEIGHDKRPAAVESVARRWVRYDPEAALGWMSGIENAAERRRAVVGIAESWSGSDSYAVSEWIGSLSAGVDRDHAAGALVRSIAGSEPDSAWAWAQTIEDPDTRASSLQTSLGRWRKDDLDGARMAVEQSESLSSEEKNALRAWLQSPDSSR